MNIKGKSNIGNCALDQRETLGILRNDATITNKLLLIIGVSKWVLRNKIRILNRTIRQQSRLQNYHNAEHPVILNLKISAVENICRTIKNSLYQRFYGPTPESCMVIKILENVKSHKRDTSEKVTS